MPKGRKASKKKCSNFVVKLKACFCLTSKTSAVEGLETSQSEKEDKQIEEKKPHNGRTVAVQTEVTWLEQIKLVEIQVETAINATLNVSDGGHDSRNTDKHNDNEHNSDIENIETGVHDNQRKSSIADKKNPSDLVEDTRLRTKGLADSSIDVKDNNIFTKENTVVEEADTTDKEETSNCDDSPVGHHIKQLQQRESADNPLWSNKDNYMNSPEDRGYSYVNKERLPEPQNVMMERQMKRLLWNNGIKKMDQKLAKAEDEYFERADAKLRISGEPGSYHNRKMEMISTNSKGNIYMGTPCAAGENNDRNELKYPTECKQAANSEHLTYVELMRINRRTEAENTKFNAPENYQNQNSSDSHGDIYAHSVRLRGSFQYATGVNTQEYEQRFSYVENRLRDERSQISPPREVYLPSRGMEHDAMRTGDVVPTRRNYFPSRDMEHGVMRTGELALPARGVYLPNSDTQRGVMSRSTHVVPSREVPMDFNPREVMPGRNNSCLQWSRHEMNRCLANPPPLRLDDARKPSQNHISEERYISTPRPIISSASPEIRRTPEERANHTGVTDDNGDNANKQIFEKDTKLETNTSENSDLYINNMGFKRREPIIKMNVEKRVTDPRKFGSLAHIRQIKGDNLLARKRLRETKSKVNSWNTPAPTNLVKDDQCGYHPSWLQTTESQHERAKQTNTGKQPARKQPKPIDKKRKPLMAMTKDGLMYATYTYV